MTRCYIIAEVGLSHKGERQRAFESIEAFAKAGADAIKWQDHSWQKVPAGQRHPSPHVTMTRAEWYEKTQFSMATWRNLRSYCESHNVDYICSPFSVEALRRQVELKPRYIKIASGEVTNVALLEAARDSGVPVLVSLGMAQGDEWQRAYAVWREKPFDVQFMTCASAYPCPPECSRLYDAHGGQLISDHTQGWWFPVAAAARGATMIEKHAALDRVGHSDADVCLLPDEFRVMVDGIRNVEKALYEAKEPDLTEIRRVYLHGG